MTHPLVEKYLNKVISARLPEKELEYFFKFAQQNNTQSISTTIIAMIEKLREQDSYSDVELSENPFEGGQFNREFLEPKDEPTTPKETISLESEKLPEPPRKKRERKEKEDEDVFTI